MHEILEIRGTILVSSRFTAINSSIMNCSSVLPVWEVIASAGSNHFMQLPQLSIPFRMIGILARRTRRGEDFSRYGLILETCP